jgi:hypothetical protein
MTTTAPELCSLTNEGVSGAEFRVDMPRLLKRLGLRKAWRRADGSKKPGTGKRQLQGCVRSTESRLKRNSDPVREFNR